MNLKELDNVRALKYLPVATQRMFRCIKPDRLEIWFSGWQKNTDEVQPDRIYRFRNKVYETRPCACSDTFGPIYRCGNLHYLATESTSYEVGYRNGLCTLLREAAVPVHREIERVAVAVYHKYDHRDDGAAQKAFLSCVKISCLEVFTNEWVPAGVYGDSFRYRITPEITTCGVSPDCDGYIYSDGKGYLYVDKSGDVYEACASPSGYRIKAEVSMTMKEWAEKEHYLVGGVKYA